MIKPDLGSAVAPEPNGATGQGQHCALCSPCREQLVLGRVLCRSSGSSDPAGLLPVPPHLVQPWPLSQCPAEPAVHSGPPACSGEDSVPELTSFLALGQRFTAEETSAFQGLQLHPWDHLPSVPVPFTTVTVPSIFDCCLPCDYTSRPVVGTVFPGKLLFILTNSNSSVFSF